MRSLPRHFALGLVLAFALASTAHPAQDLLWVRGIGTPANDQFSGVVPDSEGNIDVAGDFSGTIDLDPEAGVFPLTAKGSRDVFVARFDRDGRLVRAGQIGGLGASAGSASTGSVANDGAGHLYIAGGFSGTVDFDPGPGVYEMTASVPGNSDAFIVKLTTTGDFVWARQISCPSGGAGPVTIAADAGAVYSAGTINGACDFDPGPGTALLTSTAGAEDVYVSKLDATGNYGWATAFASTGSDIPNGITVDGSGNVYTTGRARGSIDYDPGPGTDLQSGDFFVIKQRSDGTEDWARTFVSGLARAFGVAVDAAGGVYVAGQYFNTTDFDPGPGTALRTPTPGGLADGFVLKLDAAGSYTWVYTFGSTLTDVARRVAVMADGTVQVAGLFSGTVDFDPGPGTATLTSAGGSDALVLTLADTGQFLRAIGLGSASTSDQGLDIGLDPGGNLLVAGIFGGSVDFDPGPGSTILTSAGGNDAFLWKYGWSELHLKADTTGPTTIAFSPGSPASFDIVKGLVSDLRSSGTYAAAACFVALADAPVTDSEVPPAGDAFYYLARGRNCCAAEGYGDSTTVPDPRDALDLASPCP
jgi:hypothetical protein